MEKLTEEQINGMTEDLHKFAKKSNAMMVESTKGEAGQLLKLILLRRLVDNYFLEVAKIMDKDKLSTAEQIIDKFIKCFYGQIKTIKKEKKNEKN